MIRLSTMRVGSASWKGYRDPWGASGDDVTGVQSVDRAFAVLRAVATGGGGVSEIARRTGLAVSTTARLLGTLEAQGAVARSDPGPTYRIGPALTDLAATADPAAGLVGRARAHLEMLVADVGESAGISIPTGERSVLYLDQVDGDQDVTLRDWTGEQLPLHVVSSGLVLLAARADAAVRAYARGGLDRYTEHTVTRVGELRRRVEAVRADGHAWTVEEYAVGITSVAAPIRDGRGTVVGALHVHGPSYRLRAGDRGVTSALLDTAARV
jgi:DNA-binding IclR family transcriptional regulator